MVLSIMDGQTIYAIILLLILPVEFTGGSFLYGEPCNERNTAYLRIQKWEVPENTKCVDITGFKKNMFTKVNISSYAPFFQQSKKAHTLYSDHLNLTKFPVAIVRNLPNVELIDLSGNLIKRVPNKLFLVAPKLNKLLISDNRVFIPKRKPFLSSLTLGTLMLSNNRISAIYKHTFMKLPALEVLYLDNNNLRRISSTMFQGLPNLKYLHLGRNYLTKIPPKSEMSKSIIYYITKSQNTVDHNSSSVSVSVLAKGYSVAALLAILFALPFAWRVLVHREQGHWRLPVAAFYFAHLELFLGNGCLGVGVAMLLALTLERYVSVCHPGYARPVMGSPLRAVTLIPLGTFVMYVPTLFRSQVKTCKLLPENVIIYQRTEDGEYLNHPLYSVYKVILELIFKVIPVFLLAALNLRILVVYRRSCERRRKMTLSRKCSGGEEDPRKFAEERRLVLLLGSTSILFLICVTPMVILNVTLSEVNLMKYPYQVFRAVANLLEITNYSITFYIYCSFSEDFRNTLLRTLSMGGSAAARGLCKQPPPTATTTITHQPKGGGGG